jgi:HK97 family phage major capsid protein
MPEIELKDAKDLEKVLGDMNHRVNDIEQKIASAGDADGEGRKVLETELKDLRGVVSEMARKRTPAVMSDTKCPVKAEDFKSMGWKAILNAPTKVEKTTYGWTDPEGDIAEFQEASDNLYLLSKMLRRDSNEVREMNYYKAVYRPAFEKVRETLGKAFDISDAGGGAEWVGAQYSTRFFEKLRLEMRVANLFEQFTMPRSPFVFPVQLADLTPYTFAENTASDGQTAFTESLGTTVVTGNVTFTAHGLAVRALTSKFQEEDSYVAMLPFLQQAVVQAARNGIEDCIINGDTTGVHMDNDIEAVALHAATIWNGLRHAAMAFTADVGAGGNLINTDANFRDYVMKSRGLMGKYGVNPADLALIVSPIGYNQLLSIPALATAASLIPGTATNVTGALGRIWGMDIIVSEFMKDNLAATGVNTVGGPNTFTGMVIVNRRAWLLGTVRQVTVQVLRELYSQFDQDGVTVTWRGDFQSPYGATGTVNHTGWIYDIALS